ncbi:hypothetical protein ACG04Q_02245 [Roseateles sp. DXS20W]|uniref:Carbohydrate-binding domain-containing protein n=1 Tax=Pelomonas lactea TaxID=3299030 RepID=A0ABW7GET3_9BURK
MKRAGLLALALLSTLARAQGTGGCDPAIEEALRSFDAKPPLEGAVVAAHCKPWPPSAGSVVAAVMAFRVQEPDAVRRNWDLPGVVALLDARTHRVLRGRRFTVGEDAATRVAEGGLVIDTANYVVAPGVRALGLRFRNDARPSGAADAWWGDELMLMVPEGRRLKPVFCQPMRVKQAQVGAISYRHSGAIWSDVTMTLAIGPRAAAGWNDLLVTATLALDGAEGAPFDPTPQRSQLTYRHDGKGYQLLERPTPSWAEYRCSFW